MPWLVKFSRIDHAAELVEHAEDAEIEIVAHRQRGVGAHDQHAGAGIADVEVVGQIEPAVRTFDVHHARRAGAEADIAVGTGQRGAVGDGDVGDAGICRR